MWLYAWLACTNEEEETFPPDQAELEVVELDLQDPSRITPARGDLEASDGRALHTWVWIGPSAGEDATGRPLLLMAHGIDGHPTLFDAFATTLAEAGVVVAAPAFPVSNREVGVGGSSIGDFAEQPADLRFVLDALLAGVEDEGSPLWRRFDPTRVAALGHSMGGATLLALTSLDGGEPRIRTEAYLSAAVTLTELLGAPLDLTGRPTLVMHGLDDTLPVEMSEQLYADLADPRWFLGIAGAGHSDPVESQEEPPIPSRAAAQAAVQALLDEVFEGEAGALDAVLATLAADGNTVLPEPG